MIQARVTVHRPGTGSFFPRRTCDARRGLKPLRVNLPGKMCLSPLGAHWNVMQTVASIHPLDGFRPYDALTKRGLAPSQNGQGLVSTRPRGACPRFVRVPKSPFTMEPPASSA